MNDLEIERATDELRQLVGWGATPDRIVTKPTLRRWSQLNRQGEDVPPQHPGNVMVRWLTRSIKDMEDDFVVRGQPVDAIQMRRCLRLLLKLEGKDQSAKNRRARVLQLLGLNFPLSQMRRPSSPEREMLGLLAEHLWHHSHGTNS
jgi:hypothetical protein